jgi:phosphoserine phosphatase
MRAAVKSPHPDPGSTATSGKAAFFDVDGTLISTNVVHAYGYYAMNEGSYAGIARRTAQTVANLPVFGVLNLIDRKIFNEYFYRSTRGSPKTGC